MGKFKMQATIKEAFSFLCMKLDLGPNSLSSVAEFLVPLHDDDTLPPHIVIVVIKLYSDKH